MKDQENYVLCWLLLILGTILSPFGIALAINPGIFGEQFDMVPRVLIGLESTAFLIFIWVACPGEIKKHIVQQRLNKR